MSTFIITGLGKEYSVVLLIIMSDVLFSPRLRLYHGITLLTQACVNVDIAQLSKLKDSCKTNVEN